MTKLQCQVVKDELGTAVCGAPLANCMEPKLAHILKILKWFTSQNRPETLQEKPARAGLIYKH